jgi:very-short-patch-repair endonuclease
MLALPSGTIATGVTGLQLYGVDIGTQPPMTFATTVAYRLIIEYEGDQHRTDRNQWNRDIDRQEDFTRGRWTLIRVTSERARWPRQLVHAIYLALRANGYDGPAPEFGELWMSLFG